MFGSRHVHESLKHREVTATWYNLLRLQVPVPFCFVFRCFFLRCDLSEFTCVCPPSQGLLHWLHSDLRVHGHKASRFDIGLLFELRATFFRHLPRIPKAILALTVRCKTRFDLIQAHNKTNRFLMRIFKAAHRFLWEWHHGKVQITSLTSFTWLLLEIPRSSPDMKRIPAMTPCKRTKK